MTRHDKVGGALEANEELLVQDVRLGMGEYESHCLRCLLLGRIPRLPFDTQKNELLVAWAKSRGIRITEATARSPTKASGAAGMQSCEPCAQVL